MSQHSSSEPSEQLWGRIWTSLQAERQKGQEQSTRLPYTPAQRHMFIESADLGRFRIFPKGRRLGATRGGCFMAIEAMLQGKRVLWGDTIIANIRRYLERYFEPTLKQLGVEYRWRKQDNALEVGRGYTDFRSADNPGNWEGFGYDIVFLNEAGIILDDPYLWYNTVLPMMIDSKDSTLVAAGTPKMSQNVGPLFKELWDRAAANEPGYYGKRFSTYDNPHLPVDSIQELEQAIHPVERPQEIYGEFINSDNSGSFFRREWFVALEEAPPVVKAVRGWDFAATEPNTENPNPDWTVGVKMGITAEGRTVVLNVVMDRKGPGGVDSLMKRTAAMDGESVVQVIPVDPGAAGKVAARHFRTDPLKGFSSRTYPQTKQQGSKAVRATPFSMHCANGDVGYVRGVWNDWYFGQMTAFPSEKVHDDAPDASAAGYNALTSGSYVPPKTRIRNQ